MSKLKKVQIYFWEGQGECVPSTCDFRLEYVINNCVFITTCKPSKLRKVLKRLSEQYNINLPKVSWKAIVGDDNGGDLYAWSS